MPIGWGGSSGGGSLSGTAGKLAKFTGAASAGDSIVSDDGTTISIGGKLGIVGASPSGSQQAWITGTGTAITTMLYLLANDVGHVGVVGNNEAIGLVADIRSTFNTTAGDATARGIEVDVNSTRASGTNQLINIGVSANVSGGTTNYSFYGVAGTLRNDGPTTLGTLSCTDLTANGVVTLVGTAGSSLNLTGTASISGTTSLGGICTVAGELKLGSELHLFGFPSATEIDIYAKEANGAGGTRNVNIDASGSGVVRINSNADGIAKSGTGGLEVYAGNNSTTKWLDVKGTGIATVGGAKWSSGNGTPEGVVTGNVGDLFSRLDGGATTTLYVKTSGTGNTGWTAK